MTQYDRYMFQQRNIWPGLCQNDVSEFCRSDLLFVRLSRAFLWASAKLTALSDGVLALSTVAAPHRGRLGVAPPARPTQVTPASEMEEADVSESLYPPPPPPRRPHLVPGAPPVLVICLKVFRQ